jgi:hypothetical protein
MPLLGAWLLAVLAVLAIGVPIAAVVVWSRVRGPKPVRIASRVALVVTAQLSAVLLAAVAVNDYAYFFVSWSDLFGGSAPANAGPIADPHVENRTPSTVKLTKRSFGGVAVQHPLEPAGLPGTGARLRLPAGVTPTGWSVRSEWPSRGAVVTVPVTGRRSGLTAPAYVYLPPQYFAVGRAARRLPIVEVIGNAGHNPLNLVYQTPYPGYLLNGIVQGRASPLVLVLPGGIAATGDCVDTAGGPGGPDTYTFVARDVPDAVAARLHLRPTGYAAIGEGAGGACAVRLAVTNPARFSAAASLLGCSPDQLVQQVRQEAPPVDLLVAPGSAPSVACDAKAGRRLVAAAHPPTSVTEVGGYEHLRFPWEVWKALVPAALTWLSVRLPDRGSVS